MYNMEDFFEVYNLLRPPRDPLSDILGRRSAESWTGGTRLQNPGRPSPVQKTAGSEHALWGKGVSRIITSFIKKLHHQQGY